MPRTISSMPISIPKSIGMPDILNPVFRAIQNIGRCRMTPILTTAEPTQKANELRRCENWNEELMPHYKLKWKLSPRHWGCLPLRVAAAASADDDEAAQEIYQSGGGSRG